MTIMKYQTKRHVMGMTLTFLLLVNVYIFLQMAINKDSPGVLTNDRSSTPASSRPLFGSVAGLFGLSQSAAEKGSGHQIRTDQLLVDPSNATSSLAFFSGDQQLLAYGQNISRIPFDPQTSDVLVMLHIQKTGGSQFELHLARDTIRPPPCKCTQMREEKYQCDCKNNQGREWMFQRQSLYWPCGIHADFTVLAGPCVHRYFRNTEKTDRKRIYHIMTVLRDPVHRFLSEFDMAKKGISFVQPNLLLACNDVTPKWEDVSKCYGGQWPVNVTFEQFVTCMHNPALNRMTRMLANLSLVACNRRDSGLTVVQRDTILLQSAKYNLARYIDFVALNEYQTLSAKLFQYTFDGLEFDLTKFSFWEKTHAAYLMATLTPQQIQAVKAYNALDIHLYQFAADLFMRRLQKANIQIENPVLQNT